MGHLVHLLEPFVVLLAIATLVGYVIIRIVLPWIVRIIRREWMRP